jgi:demethylspheroidene O-methyltransferase
MSRDVGDAPWVPEEAPPAPLQRWSDWLYTVRDRLLANPRFQRWAADFPITRKIAQKRARSLFDLSAGFVYSQVFVACIELKLLEMLAGPPKTAAQLSQQLGLPLDRTMRLLLAAVSLQLLEKRSHGRFGLGALGAAFIGNPSIAAMVEHHAMLYADLRDPVALLRGQRSTTALSEYWPYTTSERPELLGAGEVARYSTLMADSQALVAGDVLDAYPFGSHRRLLDVGGGEGVFIVTAANRAPKLQSTLFDLPAVVERARPRFNEAGIADRTAIAGGDFFRADLPTDADIVTLVRILHDHDDASVAMLLRNIRRAMGPDSVLLIAEPMSPVRGPAPVTDAYFGFYTLAMGRGRSRNAAEIGELLQIAGFDRPVAHPVRRPMLVNVLTARPSR